MPRIFRVFTLPFVAEEGGFDDSVVQSWLVGRELLDVREHWMEKNQDTYLVLLVLAHEERKSKLIEGESSEEKTQQRFKSRDDWREELSYEEQQLFDLLTTWRRERALRDGVPPYLVLTNRLMSDLSKRQPESKGELLDIKFFGEGMLKRYGDELLEIIVEGQKKEARVEEGTKKREKG